MQGIVFLVVIATTIWVGVDASNLGVSRGRLGGGMLDMSVASWVICCLFVWIVAFPCYLIARGRYRSGRYGRAAYASAGYAPAPYGYGQAPYGIGQPPYGTGQPPYATAQPPYGTGQAQYGAAPMQYPSVGHPSGWTPQQAARPAAPTAPPQFSPDGRWWWNGQQWVPAPPA